MNAPVQKLRDLAQRFPIPPVPGCVMVLAANYTLAKINGGKFTIPRECRRNCGINALTLQIAKQRLMLGLHLVTSRKIPLLPPYLPDPGTDGLFSLEFLTALGHVPASCTARWKGLDCDVETILDFMDARACGEPYTFKRNFSFARN